MPTILIKNVPEDTLKELKRLKVEHGCETWADLLTELTTSCETASVDAEQKRRMRKGANGLLSLQSKVTAKWKGPTTVLEEMRRTKRHESS
jgi:hypothetical protein